MGFYAEKRDKFFGDFGFYPNKESGLLDSYISYGYEYCFRLLSDEFETNTRFSKLRQDIINEIEKKFKYKPDKYEIYAYKLAKNNRGLPQKYSVEVKSFVDDFGFRPNNELLLDYSFNKSVVSNYLSEITYCLSVGKYPESVLDELFDIKDSTLIRILPKYIELIQHNVSKLYLPKNKGDALINAIADDFAYNSGLNEKICIFIPKTYAIFGNNLFIKSSLYA